MNRDRRIVSVALIDRLDVVSDVRQASPFGEARAARSMHQRTGSDIARMG